MKGNPIPQETLKEKLSQFNEMVQGQLKSELTKLGYVFDETPDVSAAATQKPPVKRQRARSFDKTPATNQATQLKRSGSFGSISSQVAPSAEGVDPSTSSVKETKALLRQQIVQGNPNTLPAATSEI